MHVGQFIVLSLLLPTLPQEMPTQAPPTRPPAAAPSYSMPAYAPPASSAEAGYQSGSSSIRISSRQDSDGGDANPRTQNEPPRISPDYSGMPSLRSNNVPAAGEDGPPVYRLLSAEQGQGGSSSTPVLPSSRLRVGDSGQETGRSSANQPAVMPAEMRAGSSGNGYPQDLSNSRRPSVSGQDLQPGSSPRTSSGESSLQVPNLGSTRGQDGGQRDMSTQQPTLPSGYDRGVSNPTRDTGSQVLPPTGQSPSRPGDRWSSSNDSSSTQGNTYPSSNSPQASGGSNQPSYSSRTPAESGQTAPAAQFPAIDDSNTGTATEYIRSAMFHVPYGQDGLDGQPMRLEEVLSMSRSSEERLRVCQAYWQLAVAVADYHFAMDEVQWLRELSSPRSRVDQSYLAAAIAAADARYRETRLAVLSRQYELAEAASSLSRHDLPLPKDAPFIGRYATQFDLYARNRTMPSGLAKIDRALPLMLELISTRAKATAASQVAMVDARDGYNQGAIGVTEVVDRFVRTRDQRLALLGVVRDYNHLIAQYAFAVQPSQADPGRVVAMLIDTTDRANLQLEEIDPTIRQASRPGDRFSPTRPSTSSGFSDPRGFQR